VLDPGCVRFVGAMQFIAGGVGSARTSVGFLFGIRSIRLIFREIGSLESLTHLRGTYATH
jgi:hypothetical protein